MESGSLGAVHESDSSANRGRTMYEYVVPVATIDISGG